MATIPADTFLTSIHNLLAKAYERTTAQSRFRDHGPGSGLFPSLESISRENASRTSVGSGSSIAAHANHWRWSIAMANALMRGEHPSRNGAERWTVREVDGSTWTQRHSSLQLEHETWRDQLPNGFDPNNPILVMSGVAMVAHGAYHLGAIRQLTLFFREA
jgi:hypothetical protein